MATKISTDEYEAFMKTLQARKASENQKAKWKSHKPTSETIPTDEVPEAPLHSLHKHKAVFLAGADSDSGFSNSMSLGSSTPTVMSSGASLTNAVPKNTSERKASTTEESKAVANGQGTHAEEFGRGMGQEAATSDQQQQADGGKRRATKGAKDVSMEGKGRKQISRESLFAVTPSKLLEKIKIREARTEDRSTDGKRSEQTSRETLYAVTPSRLIEGMESRRAELEAEGVGSFESLTSPSVLMRTEIHDRSKSGTQSFRTVSHPSKALPDVQGEQGSSSLEPLSFQERRMREKRYDLEYGTLSSEEDSPPDSHRVRGADDPLSTRRGEADRFIRDETGEVGQQAGGSLHEYSTPAESFTSPSELFRQKPHVGFVPVTEGPDGSRASLQGMKSSTEQFKVGDSPSDLLKLRAEMIVSQRIGSKKSLDKSVLLDMSRKESLKNDIPMPADSGTSGHGATRTDAHAEVPADSGTSRAGATRAAAHAEVGIEEVKVSLSDETSDEEQHVIFGGVSRPEKEQAIRISSGSDISLIDEEPAPAEDADSSSCSDKDNIELFDKGEIIHSHKMVYKARSFPLMQVRREMLCCGNDPIACECSSRESVEKLVGLDFTEEEEGLAEEYLTDPLDDSHSWADATLRSLQLVLEGTKDIIGDDLQKSAEVRDKLERSTNPAGRARVRMQKSVQTGAERKASSTQTDEEAELEEKRSAWTLMEEKLDYTQKLLQYQGKTKAEMTQMTRMHRRAMNELLDKNDEAELKLKQQEEQICRMGDLQARNTMLEKDLAAMMEEYVSLEQAHHLNLEALDIMENKIKSLTSDLETYAGECDRLMGEGSSSQRQEVGRMLAPTISASTFHDQPKSRTAHAKIFIELDEDQNKFTIDTQVDRSFLCGDGSKTDEELLAITEDLTEYIRDELLQNLVPLLYNHSPVLESTNQVIPLISPSPSPTPSSVAAVTVTLGEGDSKVRIQAEMDAGFLGQHKNHKEVDYITRTVVEYVQDKFLERILQKLFPGEDVGSRFSISSDICSSSLHNVVPHEGAERPIAALDKRVGNKKDVKRDKKISLKKQANKEGGARKVEEMERCLKVAEAQVNALQGIIRKQEIENSRLLDKLERRSVQLKDVCSHFSESERQWMDERSVLGGRMAEMQKHLEETGRDKEGLGQRIQEQEALVSGLKGDLEKECRQRQETARKSQDLMIGIMRLKDENGQQREKLQRMEGEMRDLKVELEARRKAQEEQRGYYTRLIEEKEGALHSLVGEKERGPSVEVIKAMKRAIADLKNENLHLRTFLETLTPPYELTSTLHPTDVVTVTWNKYHALIDDNHRLTSRVTLLDQEKAECHLLMVENQRLASKVNRLQEEGGMSPALSEENHQLIRNVGRLEKGTGEFNAVVRENHRLISRLNQLEKEREGYIARGMVLDRELQRFQTEMGDLKSCIANLTGDLREAILQSRNLEHRLETDELKAEYRLETRIRDVTDSKRVKESVTMQKMTVLATRNKELERERAGWTEELRKLSEMKATLENNLSASSKKLMECQDGLKETTTQLNIKQSQLMTASGLLEELKYEKGGLSTKLLDLHQDLLKAQAQTDRMTEQRQGEVLQLQSKIASLEEDLHRTGNELDQAQISLEEARSGLKVAQMACQVKVQLIADLQQEGESMQRDIRGLEEKLKDRGMRALMMTDAHLHRQEEIGKLNSSLTEQTAELREVRKELAQKTEELCHQREIANKLQADIERLLLEKLRETAARSQLEGEIQKQQEQITRLQETSKHLQGEGEHLSDELKTAHREREESSSSLLQLQQQYQAMYENFTRLECKTETEHTFNAFLQEELGKTKDMVDQLKDEARDLRTELERNERTLDEKESELERSICESQEEVARLQSSLDESSTSHEALQETNEDQSQQLAEEEHKVATLTDELEQLQKEFLDERNAVKRLADEKERLRSQLDEKIERLSNQKNSLQEKLFQAEIAAKVDQCRRDSLAKELTHLRKCFDDQMSESAAAAENLSALSKEMGSLQDENSELHNTIASLEEHSQQLIKEVTDKKTEISELDDQLSYSLNQCQAYRSKIGDLEGLIQRERALTESVKNVNKEKKKKWLLRNQLFSSKVKTQLEQSEERISHLEDDLLRVNHENHLQSCEVAERSQVIQRLKESNTSLEESHSTLLEELGRTKRQLNKGQELVQSLSESLLKTRDDDRSADVTQNLSFRERSYQGAGSLETERKSAEEEIKSLEAEMKRNLKDEIQDHVKLITKQLIVPKKRELIEDIAAELSQMREQRHQDTRKIENISANLGALNTTIEQRLSPQPLRGASKRGSSTVAEMNEAIRKANIKASSRSTVAFEPRATSTRLFTPEASLLNNSSSLIGSTDSFYIPESSQTNIGT